jgi:DNA-binding CsgD family transcriptional regulator
VSELRTRADELVESLGSLADKRGGGVQRLTGLPAMVLQLRRIAPAATQSVWVMQPDYAYDPEEPGLPLARAARLRGVHPLLITRATTVQTHPLLPSIYPTALLGPAFLRALVIDRRQVMVGGPDDASGQRITWYTTRPDAVTAVVDLWEATASQCTTILPSGQEPPLDDRQLDVARLVCLGQEDDAIARTLGVTVEVVEAEVETVLTELGVRTRAEAVLTMRGRAAPAPGGAHPPEASGKLR